MQKISFTNSNNPAIAMSAVINFPEGFDAGRKYPAIAVSHPGGGVKEQTAGTYAASSPTRASSPSPTTPLIRVKAAGSRDSWKIPMSAQRMSARSSTI